MSVKNSFRVEKESTFAFDPDTERCLMAIPKKGRLFDRVMALVNGSGMDHHRPNRLDVAHCTNLPVTIIFLPAADIRLGCIVVFQQQLLLLQVLL